MVIRIQYDEAKARKRVLSASREQNPFAEKNDSNGNSVRRQKRASSSENPTTPTDGAHDALLLERLEEIDSKVRAGLGDQTIEHVGIDRLRPNPRNARKHPERQIEQLMVIIKQFGFIGAIIIDEKGCIVAGHGRYEAAKRLRMLTIPCLRISHLTAAAKAAYALADNRLAELSRWDDVTLAATLDDLSRADLEFSYEITGFDTVDVDGLLSPEPDARGKKSRDQDHSNDPDDVLPALGAGLTVSQTGDLWRAGNHRVFHGDALEAASVVALLEGEIFDQMIADTPYNVGARHISSKKFRDFQYASGEMTPAEFTAYLSRLLGLWARSAKNGAIMHVCMDWRHLPEIIAAGAAAGLTMMNVCVWVKPGAGMGTFYRSQYELVLVFKRGKARHTNNFGLGERGRSRANVWFYPSVRGERLGVNAPDGGHPTVKPVSMIADAIRDCSRRGDIILDPTGGSGTTMIAAERVGRKARLVEIDGAYVDLTIRRWQAVTGLQATRASDGKSFDEISSECEAELAHGTRDQGAQS